MAQGGKAARDKGARYERAVRAYLELAGLDVINSNRSGYDGDDIRLGEYPGLSIEVKDHKTMALSAWLQQAREQAGDSGHPIVIHKKKGVSDVGGHYVTMNVETLLTILSKVEKWNQ